VGGKFANLARLHKAGARVPRGFAVTTSAYKEFMTVLDSKVDSILRGVVAGDLSSADSTSDAIARLIKSTPIPDGIARSIANAYLELERNESRGGDDMPVAVRSSATAEDMANASEAGQHETFLWIRGAERVVERVRDCWASAFASRSLTYRKDRGIAQSGFEMGVVVQKMVNPAKSGVMFTLNPANGDPSKVTIEATWGLGEAEVSGVVTPDLFVADKVTLEILTRKVGRKQVEFVVSGDEVKKRAVSKERQEVLCLKDDEVLELVRVGKSIEKALRAPQDIEWAMEESLGVQKSLYILQARPETVWSQRQSLASAPSGSALDIVVDTLIKGESAGNEPKG
jgi:pyruvate,water dikinase